MYKARVVAIGYHRKKSIDIEEFFTQSVSIRSIRMFLANAPNQKQDGLSKRCENCISQGKAEWCCLCQPTWRIRGSWSPYPWLPFVKGPIMALSGRRGHGSIYCHWFSWKMEYPVVWWNFTRARLQLVDFFTMVLPGERFRLLQNLGLESLLPASL